MSVSVVYLGKNDDDKEMSRMCKAIVNKLTHARVEVEITNEDSKDLPSASNVAHNDVWFCGHSRFVEANTSIRPSRSRNFGGYEVVDIAKFVNECLTRGKDKFRFICCESSQQQRYRPKKVGDSPDGFDTVLGNELLQSLTNPKLLVQFDGSIDARVSHVEGLLYAMAEAYGAKKNATQPEFEISGLWGAGDITDDFEKITAFLQTSGSLEAQSKMDDSKVKEPQRKVFKATFENAHCGKQSLPDFFGYRVDKGLLIKAVPLINEAKKAKAQTATVGK